MLPWYTPYNKDGSLRYGDNDPDGEFPQNSGPYNPVAISHLDKNLARQIQFRGYVYGEYSILPELKFTSRYSAEYLTIPEDDFLILFMVMGIARRIMLLLLTAVFSIIHGPIF